MPVKPTVKDLTIQLFLFLTFKADEQRLLGLRKLVLLVDLDQTLVHTTSEMIHPKLKGVEHFTLPGNRQLWYHTRIRPGTERFLEKVI